MQEKKIPNRLNMKAIHKSLIILSVLIVTMTAISWASAETEYKGAEFCGQCHTEAYESWAETSHANSAGLFPNVTYWTAFPSRQQTLEEAEEENTALSSQVEELSTSLTELEAAKAEATIDELESRGIPGFPPVSILLGLALTAALLVNLRKPNNL